MDKNDLEKIGLLESESKVYLALLNIGQSSVTEIAKKSELNRISVYKALDKLISKGLISSVIKADRKGYKANNPKNIQKLINEKQEELNKITQKINDLQIIFQSVKKDFEVNIYEGVKGAKSIWEDILMDSNKSDNWLILGAPKTAEIFGGYFKEFNKLRAKKKIKLKIIYNKEAKELAEIRKKQPLTEVRFMPKEFITPASLESIGDNALLVLYNPKIIVFHIKNKEVSNSFKSYFNLLWKIAKP